MILLQKRQHILKWYNLHVLDHLGAPVHIMKVYSLRKNVFAAQLRYCGSVRYETLVLEHKIMSEPWNITTAIGYVAM